ncbi:MAG: DUF4145 domain-containing protein [Bryobacteraceae bacterium]
MSSQGYDEHFQLEQAVFKHVYFLFLKCVSCRGCAIAKVRTTVGDLSREPVRLDWFYPPAAFAVQLPEGIPADIVAEFREAERCLSFGATRGASALFRSTIEKALLHSGYPEEINGRKLNLFHKIEKAAADGVLTEARKKRAHDNVRDLGNDVLHEPWRVVTEGEAESCHRYTQRILEDLYDNRQAVLAVLKAKGRCPLDFAANEK